MTREMIELVKRVEAEISKTPTGELRNLLCDVNIMMQTLNMHNSNIIGDFDLEPDFIAALNQLIKTQNKVKRKRF